MVTATHEHSQPQRSHQCLANLSEGISNGRRIVMMGRERESGPLLKLYLTKIKKNRMLGRAVGRGAGGYTSSINCNINVIRSEGWSTSNHRYTSEACLAGLSYANAGVERQGTTELKQAARRTPHAGRAGPPAPTRVITASATPALGALVPRVANFYKKK
ncbi:hypothetical protein EVAR_50861_1 [Eumeta japonica]|uniref:Uncharacterized protein n=1 Tax=Eumeta variegata TaxID=151549 RepID=A0A4C1Y8M2_EUMVA|nr:hypothetical protein EVAR_50861_1 [Eumeta japonica]